MTIFKVWYEAMNFSKSLFFLLSLFLISCNYSAVGTAVRPDTTSYRNIIGKWEVRDASILPFEHVSYCRNLNIGCVFEFDKYGVLLVYESLNARENCNQKQSYWVDDKELTMFESDMFWSYDILTLSKDSLKIRINNIPYYLQEELFVGTSKNDIEKVNKAAMRKKGTIISMVKINE